MEKNFMTVDDVAEELSVSKSKAYKIVRQLNKELEEKRHHHGSRTCLYFLFQKKSNVQR